MMKQSSGFSIIELMIALVISSMLTLLLYQSFSQSQRSARNNNSVLDVVTVMPIAYNQLEKDFSTIFVPARVFKDLAQQAQKKNNTSGAAGQPVAESPDKKPKEPFKEIFVCTLKEKNLELLSFISTHSLALYNTVLPHAVRVVYRLVPLANRPDLFSLVRQETTKIDMPLAKFKEEKIREYDLMRGVKEIKVELLVPEKPAEEPQESDKEKKVTKSSPPKQPKKYKSLTAWQGDSSEGEKPEYLIPAYINVAGIFVDLATDREYPFEWKFAVPVFDDVLVHATKAKSKKSDQTRQDPSTSPGQDKMGAETNKTNAGQNNPAQPTTQSQKRSFGNNSHRQLGGQLMQPISPSVPTGKTTATGEVKK